MLGNDAIYLIFNGFDLCFEECESVLEGLAGNGIETGTVFVASFLASVEVVFSSGVLFFVL